MSFVQAALNNSRYPTNSTGLGNKNMVFICSNMTPQLILRLALVQLHVITERMIVYMSSLLSLPCS